MATKNRCSSFTCSSSASSSSSASCSSISASLIKKQGVLTTSNVTGKVLINGTRLTKKRPPLGNITNQSNPDKNVCSNSAAVSVTANVAKTRKGAIVYKHGSATSRALPPPIPQTKPLFKEAVFCKPMDMVPVSAPTVNFISASASASIVMDSIMTVSPSCSDRMSISLDDTMSTSGSMKSPDIDYMDNEGLPSSDRKIFGKLSISSSYEEPTCADDSFKDPQWAVSISFDIYKHLRASEVKKRPCGEYMERIQKDINASMRAVLIDWLVEVAEEYRLVSDTLYLAVNYMDRYLSGNSINRTHLQLLGVTCVMIAGKYEEICAPQVDEFCYITDNTYCRDQVLRMESSVLNHLKFEMTATTIKCFLRHFVRVAQNSCDGSPTLLRMEFLASYIAELALLDYTMLAFPPSLAAASSVFLALFILSPSNYPWNRTLEGYTLYRPSDMCRCVNVLHQLYRESPDSTLTAIREKYSQHKHKFVAVIECPCSIPSLFFKDMNV